MSLVLNVEILGEFKKLTQATNGAAKDLKGLNGTVDKISRGMKTALATIGVGFSLGVVTQQLKEASKAAMEDQKSQALLANQLKNTTNATEDQIAAVEKSINKMQMSAGVADDRLRPAFAQLTRATGDTTESTKLLDLALDISAGSGKSLETVTMALTKAYNGQFGALSKLGVPMSDQILNAKDAVAAQTALNKALADQQIALENYGPKSEEYAKASQKVTDAQDKLNRITAEGTDWQGQLAEAFKGSAAEAANLDPYAKMQVIFGEMQERIGAALLPLLVKFSTWLSSPGGTEALEGIVTILTQMITEGVKVIEFVVTYKDVLIPLAAVIGTVVTGIKAVNTAMTIYNTISTALIAKNAAVAASNGAVAVSNTAVATTAGTAAAAMRALALLTSVGAVLTIPGSAPLPGTVPSTTKPPAIAPMPVFPGNAPQTGLPGANNKPPVVVNQNITVNSATTNASGVVSSLQAYQNQTGATFARLLK